jgi:hypothetical protein
MWRGDFDSVRDHPVHARVDAPGEIADGVLTFKGVSRESAACGSSGVPRAGLGA